MSAPGRARNWVESWERRVPPLLAWALAAGTVWALGRGWPAPGWGGSGASVAAGLLAVAGALVAGAGVWQFRRAATSLSPFAGAGVRVLVVDGVYGWTRNPMYLGLALALAGVVVWRGSWAAVAPWPLFCAYLQRFQIRPEERDLSAAFGPEFAAYRARVGRWCGRRGGSSGA
jgi:protein-S-isoprenylcysteine O-methyltransferase Ste14